MADVQSNIDIRIDTSSALASIKLLQAQISAFHTSMAKGTAENVVASRQLQQRLIDSINATQKFSAGIQTIKTTTESFTTALEKNKLSLGQYFKYSIAATKSFGGAFKTEMSTIDKVARERVKDLQTQYIQLGRDANGAMKAIAVRPLVLDLENMQTKTALVAQKQQILNQLLKQGSTNLLNFGKNTQWAGRQLMVGFTIPLSMAATAAAKAYMDIEKASIAIARVYGDLNTSNKEVTTMVAQIKQLAGEYTKYGIAIADTMQMASKAAAMGKTGADLLAQVNQASKLSALGMVDQQMALDTTISLTNAFGTATEKLANKIDFLNAVENQTVLSIEDMTVAIPKAAPIVKQLGGDVEDLAFFLTAMKEGGINASEGANALKSGLSSLINPTKASSEFLAGFGVNVKKIVEDDKGNLKKTVVDFASALDKIDPLNRARAIEMMFGKFQFSRISTLLQNVTKEGSQASKALELANMSSIQLAAISRKELDKLQSSPAYKFEKAIADLQLKIAPIGETFLKAVTPIIEKVSDFLSGFNKMGDGFKQFVVVGSAVLGGLAPVLLMVVGLVANGAANIIKLFANVKAFLNKTTTESQVLGETTNYLTTEQIKAEAVAASLDQTHTKLRQTFTSETSAIIALMEAYQGANAAMAGMRVPTVPTSIGKGKKFASGGIISGPGSGTSDSIPAMVSNGEAIIPAKNVARFPGLVNGLVSGNIPGFAGGTEKIGRGKSGRVGKSGFTVLRPYGANVAGNQYTDGLESFGDLGGMSDISSIYVKQIAETAGTSIAAINKEVDAWKSVNSGLIQAAEAAVSSGVPAAEAFAEISTKFKIDMEQADGPVSKFTKTAKIVYPQLEADLVAAQKAAKEFGMNVKDPAQIDALRQRLPDNVALKELSSPGNYQQRMKSRSAAMAMLENASAYGTYGVPKTFIRSNLETTSPLYGMSASQEHVGKTWMEVGARQADKQRRLSQKDFNDQAQVTAQTASESKRTRKIAKDTTDGYANELERGKKKVVATAKKTTQAESDYILRNLQIRKQQAEGIGAETASIEKEIAARRQLLAAQKENVVAQTREALQYSAPIGPVQQKASLGSRIGAKISGMGTGGMLGLAMGASVAASALSMIPGPVGQTVGSFMPLINGISMLLPVLTMLPAGVMTAIAPLAPWILGIGAVIAGTTLLIKQSEEARKKELAKINATSTAFASAETAAKNFATITGTAPTGYASKGLNSVVSNKNINAAAIKKQQEVETLLQTDEFKKGGFGYNQAQAYKAIVGIEQQKAFLQSLALSLSSQGYADDTVNALLSAIQKSANKMDLNIDFKSINVDTEAGMKSIMDSISAFSKDSSGKIKASIAQSIYDAAFKKEYDKAFKEYQPTQSISDIFTRLQQEQLTGKYKGLTTSQLQDKAREIYLKNQSDYAERTAKALMSQKKETLELVNIVKTDASNISQVAQSLATMFSKGMISGKNYHKLMGGIIKQINTYGTEVTKLNLLKNIFSTMDSDIQTMAKSFKTAEQQARYLQLAILGVKVLTEGQRIGITAPGSGGQYIGSGFVKEVTFEETVATAEKNAKKLQKILNGLNANNNSNAGGTKTNPYDDFFKGIEAKQKSVAAELAIRKDLLATGMDIADAEKLAADSAAQAAWMAAKTADEKKKIIAGLKEQLALENKLKTVEELAAEKAKKAVDTQQKQIDKKKAQLRIPEQQAQINQYNDALNVLSDQENAINKTYDERSAALEKIQKTQEAIAAAQKDQLSVADALSKGDIAAAARAVQEARANSAQRSMDNQKDQLEKSRQSQLDALTVSINGKLMTRKQIEEQIASIQTRINQLQLNEISNMEILLAKLQQESTLADIAATEKATQSSGSGSFSRPTTIPDKNKSPQLYASWVAAGSPDPKRSPSRFYAWANGVANDNAKQSLGISASAVTTPQSQQEANMTNGIPTATGSYFTRISGNESVYNEPLMQMFAGQSIPGTQIARTILNKFGKSQSDLGQAAWENEAGGLYRNLLVNTEKLKSATPGTEAHEMYYNRVARDYLGLQDLYTRTQYKAIGGLARGTDIIPAMLTPGEFVVSQPAVKNFGVDNLRAINNGTSIGDSVYNYSLSVNMSGSNLNPNDVARAVMSQIRQVDAQRIRGNTF